MGGRILFVGPAADLSSQFLNDLYGADLDTSLMFSDQTRHAEPAPRLVLARV
jgi:phosphonate transport system ATP-binding protein